VKAFLFVEKLPDSAVLVTARPSANEDILLRSSKPQKRIEVLGFDQKSVEAYVSGVFKDEPEKLKKFTAYYSPSNPVVNSMMYVPLNAAIVVYIFENEPDSLLPRTLTELYLQLCRTILNRALLAQKRQKISNFEDLSDNPDLYEQFNQLLKIAFKGVESDTVIFYAPPHDFVNLGFLDAVSSFDKKDYTYNFLHLTIQEFFAAYFISKLDNSGFEIFKQHGKDKRWNVVWRFVAGLTKFKDYDGLMGEDIFFYHDLEESRIIVSLFFIQCFFEAKSINYIYYLKNDNSTSLSYYEEYSSQSALDMYALGYSIANYPTGGRPWSLRTHSAAVEFLVSGLTLNQPVAGAGIIKELDFVSMSELPLIKFWHHFRDLRVLKFISSHSHQQISLTEIIPNMNYLEILDVSDQYHDSHSMLEVLQAVSASSVTSLNIMSTGFTTFLNQLNNEYYPALKALTVPFSGKLKELIVGDVKSFYHDNAGLMQVLSSHSSLETLHLCHLPPHLSLMNNTNLKKLTISYDEVADESAIDIAEIVKHNNALKHLEVYSFLIPRDLNVLKTIVNAIIYNNTVLEGVRLLVMSEEALYARRDIQVHMEINYKELTVDSRIIYYNYVPLH
jgi:hypothetical protein